MRFIWDEGYPAVYAAGVGEGLRLAFETPVSNRLQDQRGKLCPCRGDSAFHAGFKAGWTAARRVRARRAAA